ncbi:MAG: hypothetical protein ACW980_21535 [Promethearchaeota archaeon]|jgi:hypothetical protein
MEKYNFNQAIKIDKERLLGYYKRIKNQSSSLTPIEIIAEFLVNQSIMTSSLEAIEILNHYKDKIIMEKKVLDFAFEWIRAHHFRSEYKRHLIREQYTDYCVAIDDCISLFFLDYDEYIRKIFKKDMEEFEFSILYEILFSPFNRESLNLNEILEKYRQMVPTVFYNKEKINTKLFTLRCGLSEIIQNDYIEVSASKLENIRSLKTKKKLMPPKKTIFNGTMIERLMKFYTFNKNEILNRELEISITQLLSSYFQIGIIYKIEEFNEILIKNLADHIYSGLTEEFKEIYPLETLESKISIILSQYKNANKNKEFKNANKNKELDGSAWINELKNVLEMFLSEFIKNLYK